MTNQPRSAPSQTNTSAVASLVLGILWLAGIGSILAVVFGAVALRQTQRTGEGGKGLAVAGVTLGIIGGAIAVPVILGGILVGTDVTTG